MLWGVLVPLFLALWVSSRACLGSLALNFSPGCFGCLLFLALARFEGVLRGLLSFFDLGHLLFLVGLATLLPVGVALVIFSVSILVGLLFSGMLVLWLSCFDVVMGTAGVVLDSFLMIAMVSGCLPT